MSPLLANLYFRRVILGWKVRGYADWFRVQIVNYADGFVICYRGKAEEALAATRVLMAQLKLTVNLLGHSDARTTRLYDRRQKRVSRNIVERISV